MVQLYVFIGALCILVFIVTRRRFIFNRVKKIKFREEIAQRVDELQKERIHVPLERFRDAHLQEQKNKKYDFAQFKILIRKADMAMSKKQWNEAKKYLIQSLALTRDEFPVSVKLAQVYLESGDLKRAEMLYKRLIEVDAENPALLCQLARIYTKKKLYKDAIQRYVQALEADEKDDKILVNLGYLYQLLMRHSLAAECFRRAAELKPREAQYLFLLADACRGDQDYENALFTYEKILTLEPYNEKAINGAQDMRIRISEMERMMGKH